MKLADLLTRYIQLQRDRGRRFRADAVAIRAFSRAMGDVDVADVDPKAVQTFLTGAGPVTAHAVQKYRYLTAFYRFAVARGFADSSPLPADPPKSPPSLTPHIYTSGEISRMLQVSETFDNRASPLQGTTLRTLLLLLYGTGMRIGEALSLNLADVDLPERIVCVRDTKFYKTRLVPLGPKLTAELDAYARRRRVLALPAGEASAFFATRTGARLSYERASRMFRRVRALAGIRRETDARYQPRLHDLRHTATVHRVVHWYRTGQDVQRLLPQLATYLGHVGIASTQRYLNMTPELLQAASIRFEQYAQPENGHER